VYSGAIGRTGAGTEGIHSPMLGVTVCCRLVPSGLIVNKSRLAPPFALNTILLSTVQSGCDPCAICFGTPGGMVPSTEPPRENAIRLPSGDQSIGPSSAFECVNCVGLLPSGSINHS
jgi:hypothetical protein